MNKEILEKLWKSYRQVPVLPATLAEPLRGALRGSFGCLASVEHLKASISHCISDGYRENSPFIQTMRTRMAKVEKELEEHLRVLNEADQHQDHRGQRMS